MMDEITLKISAQTYNAIVQALQEMPWKIANPALQEIDPQVREALKLEGLKGEKTPDTP